jgi:hypothetical protein
MALFVHLAAESQLARIRRNGITRMRRAAGALPRGVFAAPVTSNFYASHQWVRELRRRNKGRWLALTSASRRAASLRRSLWTGSSLLIHAEAVAHFASADDPLGWEVLIPRRIEAKEIHRTRRLTQVVGWRFYPKAKGKPPFCTCKFCARGEYGAAKLRRRLGSPDEP